MQMIQNIQKFIFFQMDSDLISPNLYVPKRLPSMCDILYF